jgi:hypothetical protein
MASSDDFKAQLKAGNITEALALALSEAVELKFTTWVPADEEIEATSAPPGHRLRTRINSIEGVVEHEIGEEFIGTGRYRELKQLHLEQVAEGSKLIASNLQSLQKLFEVLVALRYPPQEPPVVEPSPPNIPSPLLPEGEGVVDRGSEPQETVADTGSTQGVTATEIPVAEFVAESQEAAAADAWVSADTQIEETIAEESSTPLAEQPITAPPVDEPVEDIEEEEEDEEDDWDSSVLDLLESIPVVPMPPSETSESEEREEWGWEELVREEAATTSEALDTQDDEQDWVESYPPSEAQNFDSTSSPVNEDMRDLMDEQPTDSSPSDLLQDEQWTEDLEPAEETHFSAPPAQNLETSTTPVDDDWGDFLEDEVESDRTPSDLQEYPEPTPSGQQNLNLSTTPVDEDWGDFIEDESDIESGKSIPSLDSLDLAEDEEWEDWVMDEPAVLADAPVIDMDSLDLGEDEDWGDLGDESDPFAMTSPSAESVANLDNDEDWADFADEELEPSPGSLQAKAEAEENFDLSSILENEESLSEESKPQTSAENTDTPEDSPEEKNAKPKSADKRVPPPPPPPSRFPHSNDE